MADQEVHGKNWYKDVGSPSDRVPYERRLDFYLKRAEIKTGLAHLAKDFDVTLDSQIQRGVFKSLEDLKKIEKKEYKIKSGDTIFKILVRFFREITDAQKAEKEAYLTLAYLMKTQHSSNVDQLLAGGKVTIENGKISVCSAKGTYSYHDALMRPEGPVTPPVAPPSALPPTPPEVVAETGQRTVEDRDTQYLESVAKKSVEKKAFETLRAKVEDLGQRYEQLADKNITVDPAKTETQTLLQETQALIETQKTLPPETYLAQRIDTFKEEIKPQVEAIAEKTLDPVIQAAARVILDLPALPQITPAAPAIPETIPYNNQELSLNYTGTTNAAVNLDENEKYFYHWLTHYVDEQGLFLGNTILNNAPLDDALRGVLIDKVIAMCRTLNPKLDLDNPKSFDGKTIVLPAQFTLTQTKGAEVIAIPDAKIKDGITRSGLSKLARLGEKEKYFVLTLPSGVDPATFFPDWQKIFAFNQKAKITVKAGQAFCIPADLLPTLDYQGDVRFIVLSLKNSTKKDAIVTALCKDNTQAAEWVHIFTESYFYRKIPNDEIVIPVALLKEDWRTYLLQEYTVKPAEFRKNALYHTGDYGEFVQHATKVEGLTYVDRAKMVSDHSVEAVTTTGKNFRFKENMPAQEQYLRPYASTVLTEVAAEFYKQTRYMLVVSSLFRTPDEQKDLAEYNAAATKGVSTHTFANSFDLSNGRFITPDGKEETWSGVSGAEKEKLTDFRPTIEKILLTYQAQGKLMALREAYAWHVMVANPAIGDGSKIPPAQRTIDDTRETQPLVIDARQRTIDFTKLKEFAAFNTRMLTTLRDRKKAGKPMHISELQTLIRTDFLKSLRDSGQSQVADRLAGRTFEIAHTINILASTQQGKLGQNLCIYDERPDVASEIPSFEGLGQEYALFKEARTDRRTKLQMVDRDGHPAGDYNMYQFLTDSNVNTFVDPYIFIAKIAQETSFSYVKNLGGETSDYTGQTVFGYFQITSKQDAATEKRAKEIFNSLTGIPGTKFDFKEFRVHYGKGNYYTNPRAEIALAIAIEEKNAQKIRAANGGKEHPDEELLTILSYNHGTLYITDLLQYGITVSEYKVPNGYKLSYVDNKGTVHTLTVSKQEKDKIRQYLRGANKPTLKELQKYVKKQEKVSFTAGNTVNLRISEIEKAASLARGGKGQLYVSQILAKSILLQYIDRANYEDLDDHALADAITVLAAPVVTVSDIHPRDRH